MALWLQNLIVLLAVGGCLLFVGWQIVATLRGRKSRAGSCCAKGCAPNDPAADQAKSKPERIVFMPVEMLGRRRH